MYTCAETFRGANLVRVKFLSLIVLISLLAACSGNASDQIAQPTAIPSPTLQPTATVMPTPSTPLAILVLPPEMDKPTADLYQSVVYELAQSSGFRFQVRNRLSETDLKDPTLKAAIVLPPDPGIVNYALAAPQTQFLAVDLPGVVAGGNISALGGGDQVEIPAFLAGYVLSMLLEDYHVGILIPKDDQNGLRALYAFDNGKKYYCGLCRPFYLSPVGYPQFLEIPADELPSRYGGYANVLINDLDVDGLYIYPTLADPDFLSYIGTQGVYLIGASAPEPKPGGWVMTIRSDTVKAIRNAWPYLISGQGGMNIPSPLGIADVDPTILTPGKLRLAQETLDALLAGRILTSNP